MILLSSVVSRSAFQSVQTSKQTKRKIRPPTLLGFDKHILTLASQIDAATSLASSTYNSRLPNNAKNAIKFINLELLL